VIAGIPVRVGRLPYLGEAGGWGL